MLAPATRTPPPSRRTRRRRRSPDSGRSATLSDRRRRSRPRRDRDRDQHRRHAGHTPHGPGGTCTATQPGNPRRGDDPSGRACTALPGQRSRTACRPCNARDGNCIVQLIGVVEREREQRRLRAHVVAVGVVVGARLAEVGERRHDIGRVVAQVVELRLGRPSPASAVERDRRDPCQRRRFERELGQVTGAGRVADQRVELAERRDRGVDQREELFGELGQSAGRRASTRRPAGSARRVSSAGRGTYG